MSNPVADWIRNHMTSNAIAAEETDKRIAFASLASQRFVDERNSPSTAAFWNDWVDRREIYDHLFVAHADLKAFRCGCVNTPEAATHYCSLALHRRHQLLKQYPNAPTSPNE